MKTLQYKGFKTTIQQCSRTFEFFGQVENQIEINFRTNSIAKIMFEFEHQVDLFLIKTNKFTPARRLNKF